MKNPTQKSILQELQAKHDDLIRLFGRSEFDQFSQKSAQAIFTWTCVMRLLDKIITLLDGKGSLWNDRRRIQEFMRCCGEHPNQSMVCGYEALRKHLRNALRARNSIAHDLPNVLFLDGFEVKVVPSRMREMEDKINTIQKSCMETLAFLSQIPEGERWLKSAYKNLPPIPTDKP